jgi:hypothetical protein
MSRFPPFIQVVITPEISCAGTADTVAIEDDDFDMMFSGKLDPVVGSCRTGALPLFERIAEINHFSEFMTQSYCA